MRKLTDMVSSFLNINPSTDNDTGKKTNTISIFEKRFANYCLRTKYNVMATNTLIKDLSSDNEFVIISSLQLLIATPIHDLIRKARVHVKNRNDKVKAIAIFAMISNVNLFSTATDMLYSLMKQNNNSYLADFNNRKCVICQIANGYNTNNENVKKVCKSIKKIKINPNIYYSNSKLQKIKKHNFKIEKRRVRVKIIEANNTYLSNSNDPLIRVATYALLAAYQHKNIKINLLSIIRKYREEINICDKMAIIYSYISIISKESPQSGDSDIEIYVKKRKTHDKIKKYDKKHVRLFRFSNKILAYETAIFMINLKFPLYFILKVIKPHILNGNEEILNLIYFIMKQKKYKSEFKKINISNKYFIINRNDNINVVKIKVKILLNRVNKITIRELYYTSTKSYSINVLEYIIREHFIFGEKQYYNEEIESTSQTNRKLHQHTITFHGSIINLNKPYYKHHYKQKTLDKIRFLKKIKRSTIKRRKDLIKIVDYLFKILFKTKQSEMLILMKKLFPFSFELFPLLKKNLITLKNIERIPEFLYLCGHICEDKVDGIYEIEKLLTHKNYYIYNKNYLEYIAKMYERGYYIKINFDSDDYYNKQAFLLKTYYRDKTKK